MVNENVGAGKYIVGYLDVLGFKYHLQVQKIETIKNSLERVVVDYVKHKRSGKSTKYWRAHQKRAARLKRRKWDEINIDKYTIINFSDCIFIFSKLTSDDKRNRLLFVNLCEIMNEIIFKPILDPNPQNDSDKSVINFAYAGGVSMGQGYVDGAKKIFFGKPFTRSYQFTEDQQWMGGLIDHNYVPKEWILEYCGYDHPIIKYPVPGSDNKGKNKVLGFFALNWPQCHWCEDQHKRSDVKREGPQFSDLVYHINRHDWGVFGVMKKNKSLEFAKSVCQLWDENEG